MDSQELLELGFEQAGKKLQKAEDLRRKMAIAYEHFRFVEPHIFNRFQEQLKIKTLKIVENCPRCNGTKKVSGGLLSSQACDYCRGTGARRQTYDKLRFTNIKQYGKIPPTEVLGKVKEAIQKRCFDTFEVADIETVEERPDPIIFGLIEGCDDKFFIAQWDNDVKIDDILQGNEG